MPTIREVRYLTARRVANPSFEATFAERCAMLHASDPDAAVAVSDIVITATPGAGALFSIEAVRPGTHINAVGTDTNGKRELPPGLLSRARVIVDDREQSRQIGEGQWYDDLDVTEIGDVLTSQNGVSRHTDDITVFDMTGLALQDLTVARMLQRCATDTHQCTRIPWPWEKPHN